MERKSMLREVTQYILNVILKEYIIDRCQLSHKYLNPYTWLIGSYIIYRAITISWELVTQVMVSQLQIDIVDLSMVAWTCWGLWLFQTISVSDTFSSKISFWHFSVPPIMVLFWPSETLELSQIVSEFLEPWSLSESREPLYGKDGSNPISHKYL